MLALRLLVLTLLVACAIDTDVAGPSAPVSPPDVDVSTPAIEDVRCAENPDAGAATGFRHTGSSLIATLGDPVHRGVDLIATTADTTQVLDGKLTYGDLDKDLQDEDVELFACFAGMWRAIGDARTDSDGRFALALTGERRLPAGMRDMFVSVAGDRSGARFLAFVAPPGSPVVVSDVDGTLTGSENAYPISLATDTVPPAQPGAAAALHAMAARGISIVYVTARGDRFTQDTREWFVTKGFPRGPVRMPRSIITLPGDDTIEFKSEALAAVADLSLVAGVGNRATDVAAYTNAGLAPDRILIKLPEFEEEVADALAAATATGFDHYDAIELASP